jgi:hypothetical protein
LALVPLVNVSFAFFLNDQRRSKSDAVQQILPMMSIGTRASQTSFVEARTICEDFCAANCTAGDKETQILPAKRTMLCHGQ